MHFPLFLPLITLLTTVLKLFAVFEATPIFSFFIIKLDFFDEKSCYKLYLFCKNNYVARKYIIAENIRKVLTYVEHY